MITIHIHLSFIKKDGIKRDGDEKMIPALAAVVVVLGGLSITTTYMVLEVQKRKKERENMDFKCPQCGFSVDGSVSVCPECLAEFKDNEFECPVCGSAVSADTKACVVCNERFEEEEIFACPHCGEPIAPDAVVCAKCDEEFWSPVKPADVAEVEAIPDVEEAQETASEAASP
jgi:DNA-directed RNA polymerase subunit RPC12/RpoP